MNISPFSPKLEDFRLSLLKATYAHVPLISRIEVGGKPTLKMKRESRSDLG